MIKRQLYRYLDTADNDDTEEPEPPIKYQLAKRIQVQKLLCDLVKDLSL